MNGYNDQVTLYFYDITGKRTGVAPCGYSAGMMRCNGASYDVYFGGRPMSQDGQTVFTDRLGSVTEITRRKLY